MFITDGLPKALLKNVVSGDIHAVFLRIMSVGQLTHLKTKRMLSNKLGTLSKGKMSWPCYHNAFQELCDVMEGCAGLGPDGGEIQSLPDDYLLSCLINGLPQMTDTNWSFKKLKPPPRTSP